MLKLQELKRSLFGAPTLKRSISFLRCGYLCSETPTRLFRVYQQAVEGHAAGHFLYLQPLQSTRHALYIYLAIWTDRAFLHMMGSKPWTCSLEGLAQTKIASASWRPIKRRVYLYPTKKLAGQVGGSMGRIFACHVEIRVQFPANARTRPPC